MTKSVEASSLLESTHEQPVMEAHAVPMAGRSAACSLDRQHLMAIMSFLNREIGLSAAILRDLTARISSDLCALSDAGVAEPAHERIMTSTVALQDEDRVQQRLTALRNVITILEKTLAADEPQSGGELDRTIIDKLCLDEIRCAFALSVGMTYVLNDVGEGNGPPSLGDVDLF